MNGVYVKMFGTPAAYIEGNRMSFPFKKVEALFYYLIVKKEASRDELVNLLWSDVDEETAKKNLRNALYRIKKTFNSDIVISPNKWKIELNDRIDLYSDLDKLLNDGEKWIEAYSGEFLQGFNVKDGENFEEWVDSQRLHYRDIYIEKLYDSIEGERGKSSDLIESYAKLIIGIDAFDERAHRILMDYYIKKGLYNKAVDVYKNLCKVLDFELGITPDVKTTELYNNIQEIRSSRENHTKDKREDFFYGRETETKKFWEIYSEFLNGNTSKFIAIMGEAGIGKTKLKDRFFQYIDKDDIFLFEANCYQAEERYFLKPWNSVISGIAKRLKEDNIQIPSMWRSVISYIFPIFAVDEANYDTGLADKVDSFKYQMAEEAIIGVLKRLAEKKKIIIVLEDVHWMDSTSLALLNNILLHDENNNIMVIGTCRNGYDRKLDKYMSQLMKYNKLEKIEISRFTMEETRDLIEMVLSGETVTSEIMDKIYYETEGNTFFIIEFLNSIREKRDINIMSSKTMDILKSRFIDVSEEGSKILNIVSLFFDEAPVDIIMNLSGKDELEIISAAEELEERYILREVNSSNKTALQFTHQKLREFIYLQQSSGKRKILHRRVGEILEKTLQNDKRDIAIYSKLIYHFNNGGDKIKALEYSIKNAAIHLDFSHELFPVLYDFGLGEQGHLYISKVQTRKYLEDIDGLLNEVQAESSSDNHVRELKWEYLYMKGRYLIREGEYEDGIEIIESLIENSIKTNNVGYVLKGYRQLIYYCIQVHDSELMKNYLEKALKVAEDNKFTKEIGVLLRFKGLNDIMLGDYENAEKYLKQSINTLKIIDEIKNVYSLNIAAAYNYIGEIRRHTMKFPNALKYYDKAIDMCIGKNALSSLAIFNTNAGQAAFEMGDYLRAKGYFKNAINAYQKLDSTWGRSTAEGYMALLSIKEGNYNEAINHLNGADEFSIKLKSPYELGLVYRIKAEIRSMMETNTNLRNEFNEYLSLDLNEYCDKGIELLDKARDSYEIDILRAIRRK